METLFIPNESDFKRWIREAVKEFFENTNIPGKEINQEGEKLLNRKEIAGFLRVSLVTLNDWVNRGLPSHKQKGRVYFDKQEVKEYIKTIRWANVDLVKDLKNSGRKSHKNHSLSLTN